MSSNEIEPYKPVDSDAILSHFPEGSKRYFNKDGFDIYDKAKLHRWSFYDYLTVDGKQQYRSLTLQCRTSLSTWHRLIGINQSHNPQFNRSIVTVVSLNIINPKDIMNDEISTAMFDAFYTKKHHGILSVRRNPGGYYGPWETTAHDLQNLHALAIDKHDLPFAIDIDQTAHAIFQSFYNGKFDPPPFVLPKTILRFPAKINLRLPSRT